jgi:hypothetical protein
MLPYQTVGLWEEELQIKWPLRSPDLRPSSFCEVMQRKGVFVPNLPLGTDGLKFKIVAAIETVDGNMSEGI